MGVPDGDAFMKSCWAMICHDPRAEATPPEARAGLAAVNKNPAGFVGAVLLLRLRAKHPRGKSRLFSRGERASLRA